MILIFLPDEMKTWDYHYQGYAVNEADLGNEPISYEHFRFELSLS